MDTLTFEQTGPLIYDAELGEHRKAPIAIRLLDRADAEIVIAGYFDDPAQAEFNDVLRNLFECDRTV